MLLKVILLSAWNQSEVRQESELALLHQVFGQQVKGVLVYYHRAHVVISHQRGEGMRGLSWSEGWSQSSPNQIVPVVMQDVSKCNQTLTAGWGE